ncbi:family S53 protease-like protein [Gymnopus androsaceus JB14]|uniref:tripeptidyl-peptidase II n=1 Tax=Gymnopus androsaceus JB14 TaxID=1447944 RepID=A0A6A4I278_9AGAR|nr:family S53 protease-like protein [Gymnopus androsaceus JB14]
MALCKLLTLLSIIAMASAAMVVHESRTSVPAGFVSQGAAPANDMLTLRVALTSNNVAGLEEQLMSLSTPGSSEFRQWLSMEEVKAFVQPSSETVSAFSAFASANGLEPTLPVSQANQLFAAQFEVFTHPDMPDTITRTLSVSLPSELVGHVDVIHPTTEFTGPNTRLAPTSFISLDRRAVAASCNSSLPSGVVTPTCLQELYGIPTTPATEKTNSLLVTAYEDEFAQTADLSEFLKLLRPDIPSTTTFTLLTTAGGINTQNPEDAGTEADLDIEYTTGIATDVPIEFLAVGGNNFATSLLDTTTFLDGVATPPSVMTTSYGDTETDIGSSMATKICNGYMALGTRGISVVFASGDGGVRGNHDTLSICDDNTFMPVFPAACPFVTAVGSTQGFGPEKAINFTGGGFSNFFPTPSYQTAAVASFLKTVPSNFAGTFNKAGRGYPDLAVQGWNFEIVAGGETGLVGGTSASSPTFAGIIALINDRLIAAGKPVLGFLNPFIYSTASTAFTDITIGHNSGFVCPASSVAFDAAVGWDALTGFGTPIFPNSWPLRWRNEFTRKYLLNLNVTFLE